MGDLCQWLTVEFGHLQTRISGQLLWDLVGHRLVFSGNCRGARCGTSDGEKLLWDSVGQGAVMAGNYREIQSVRSLFTGYCRRIRSVGDKC